MRPLLRSSIISYNGDDYDVMRTYLVTQFGLYCAYCEQPVTNDSAVEHKVPKSAERGFPGFSTQWRNVLLACQACNSAKSVTPDKRQVAKRVQDLGNEAWYLGTANLWVWPDRYENAGDPNYPPADDIYAWIRFELLDLSQDELAAAGLVRNTWAPGQPNWATQKERKIWVLPNDAVIQSLPVLEQAPTLTRVRATIAGLNLNYYNRDNLKYNDRRVDNRYAAYESARAAIDQLYSIYNSLEAPGGNATRVELGSMVMMIKAVRDAARATGFWSVWFRVFVAALNAPSSGEPWFHASKDERLEILKRTLVFYYPDEKTGGRQDAPIFPGTDAARLHLDQFT